MKLAPLLTGFVKRRIWL